MISQAIYELLSGIGVTAYPVIAPQDASYPFIIINEDAEPEDSKDGYDISYYDLQIDVYTEKGKKLSNGVYLSKTISDSIKSVLNRYSGTIGGVNIDTILFADENTFFDSISYATRSLMQYQVRVKHTESITTGIGYWQIGTTFIVQ